MELFPAPIVAECDGYEYIKDIGSGKFGVAKLMRDRHTAELVAIKFIQRGEKIDQNVKREIINHRSLKHPNVIRFKKVVLTPTHLAIVMEYASGGELLERIPNGGRFSEDEARYFFQQLISGATYCHSMQVCHRDIKLENLLLDGSTAAPRLKICDFGFSKSSVLHSQPKSTVGTLVYVAPEVLQKEYDGKCADVWSCVVTLYVMLVGAYPFEDPMQPKDFKKTMHNIMGGQYSFPDSVHISPECQHLISRIFVVNPSMRITIQEIQNHTWFLKNLRAELINNTGNNHYKDSDQPMQSIDEIMQVLPEATLPALCTQSTVYPIDFMEDEDLDDWIDNDSELEDDTSGEVIHAM